MTANQYRLLFVPLLATLIMGGFVTTVGLITGPAALKYGVATNRYCIPIHLVHRRSLPWWYPCVLHF